MYAYSNTYLMEIMQKITLHFKNGLVGSHHRRVIGICRITGNNLLFVKESSPVHLCKGLLLLPVFRDQPREQLLQVQAV